MTQKVNEKNFNNLIRKVSELNKHIKKLESILFPKDQLAREECPFMTQSHAKYYCANNEPLTTENCRYDNCRAKIWKYKVDKPTKECKQEDLMDEEFEEIPSHIHVWGTSKWCIHCGKEKPKDSEISEIKMVEVDASNYIVDELKEAKEEIERLKDLLQEIYDYIEDPLEAPDYNDALHINETIRDRLKPELKEKQ